MMIRGDFYFRLFEFVLNCAQNVEDFDRFEEIPAGRFVSRIVTDADEVFTVKGAYNFCRIEYDSVQNHRMLVR